MLILCHSLVKRELKPLRHYFSLISLREAARKAQSGLGEDLSSPLPNSKAVKVYLTSRSGAGRVVFLLFLSSGDCIPVILRLKKDKEIGENMSMKNERFKKLLAQNVRYAIEDIALNNYEELDI